LILEQVFVENISVDERGLQFAIGEKIGWKFVKKLI